jgi:RHS repeat-associated protein
LESHPCKERKDGPPATYNYDAFGNLVGSTGALTSPLGYTGRELDGETGLVFLRHRYYSTVTGRFVSEDPAGFQGGKNFYEYVRNTPLNAVDPFGLQTTVIVVYDSGPFGIGTYGSHAAVYLDNGGDPLLYDPAGSYTTKHKCGSGDACSDNDASVTKFISYHRANGSNVRTFTFDTTPEQEKQIARNIDKEGGATGGACALSVAEVIKGIGPFKNLKSQLLPGSLADQLNKLPKDCQCTKK